jgi:Fur family zinc uptake transcriptional regulator
MKDCSEHLHDYYCNHPSVQLTPKRKRILELLLEADAPLSAYELLDGYNEVATASMPPMSMYRILDYLESKQLVHKLTTHNKYVACHYIGRKHSQHNAQFFVCTKCNAVIETKVEHDTQAILKREADKAGYVLNSRNVELQGVCASCL